MVTLEKVKWHLRIDDDEDDLYLQGLMNAAIEHVSDFTGISHDENAPERFDLAVMILVAHFYANREVMSDRSSPMPYGLGMLLTSLKREWFI